jgi:hypothetical protein
MRFAFFGPHAAASEGTNVGGGGGVAGEGDKTPLLGRTAAGPAVPSSAPTRPALGPSPPPLRPKSKLANVSGFDHPPPAALTKSTADGSSSTSVKGKLVGAAYAFWNHGLLCAATSCVIFAFSGFAVKLTQSRVPVLELCLVRSFLSFCFSIALMKSMGMAPMFGHQKNAPLLVARGVCGAASMALYYASLQLLPLGDAVTIGGWRLVAAAALRVGGWMKSVALWLFTGTPAAQTNLTPTHTGLIQPPITAVAARLILKEPLGARGAIGCLVSLAGVVFIRWVDGASWSVFVV